MEHNSYINYEQEVVIALLRGENHVRGMAKLLNTNHMTVSRILSGLRARNIVDWRQEGKNKVYFFKNGTESRTAINIAENYKLARTLEIYPQLRTIVEEIQKTKEIRLAILFGSYAKGIAKESSDIDVYIESEDQSIRHKLKVLDARVSVKLGKYDSNNILIKEIEKNHVIIKGVEEYYQKNVRFFG
ncbi:MAG: nucleotidyltransferase domain-containing protein [Nanoarchaeota archaeon]